jgi:hypothetical protein
MPKTFLKKSTGWTEMKSIFVKKSTGWTETKSIFIKKLVSGVLTWVKVYTKASLPDTTTAPSIRTTNTSGVGDVYDGPAAISPRFLNDNLFGKDGVYTNFTSKFGRKFTKADAAAALPAARTTVVTGDLFTSGGGVTTSDRTSVDGKYLFFEMTVQNGSSANEIQSVSSPIKMIKREPATTDFQWTQIEQVGTQLVLNYVYENYYYNIISPGSSYIKWWRNTSDVPGGFLIKSETITDTTTGTPSTTSRSGTSYYTPTVDDIGYYVVAETTAVNSNTIHFAYTDNYSVASWSTTEPINAALNIIDVNFTDTNGRSGKNARGKLVTSTPTILNWKVTGISSSTTYRVRYRVKSNETGLYYNPFSAVQAAASLAWEVFEDNYNNTGNISSVSISGSTATLYDQFTIDSTFNGSTYGGGISRWILEYELSIVHSGIRRYWVYPNSMSSSQAHDYWDIDPTTNPSISASPATISPGGTVTFSGTFNPFPAALNSYPHSYRIVYGTSPATDSGWIALSSSPANQTYSNTKVYSTTGTYTAYVETTPSYNINYASVTVANQLTAPTLNSVTPGPQGGLVEANFTGGSGPVYQMFWWGTATAPTTAVTPDGNRTFSPVQDFTGPSGTGTQYMYVRSVLTAGETSVGPSTVASAWSNGIAFNMTSTAVSQNSAPTTRATNTFSTSTVKYLDSITWSAGTYTNAASITSVLLYSTVTSNLVSPGGNTLSSFRTANPYAIVPSDPAGTPYVFAVRDTVVGTNGTTYYFYSNQITSANADAVAFSYGTATSAAGGWTASVNSGTQSGASYSLSSGTGTVNSSTGAVTVTGLGSNVTTSVVVTKSVSGYNSTNATASGTSATVTIYTLTYNANSGSSTPTAQTGASGSTITLASGAGTRSGFSFGGWNIGGVTYAGSASYTFGSANATATAIWNAVFVTPVWNGTMPGWTAGSNFQRITASSQYKWGWTNGTFSFSGSIGSSRGWNFNGPNATQLSAGTARSTSLFRTFTTSNDTYTTVQGTSRPYLVSSLRGDVSYSPSSRFGSIQPYQFGTDGNEYKGPWTAGI